MADLDVDEVFVEEARADEAVFEAVRVPRGGRPIAAVVIASLVGGLAFVGVVGGGRVAPASEPGRSRATAEGPVVTTASDRAAMQEAPWRSRPGTGEPSENHLLAIDARRAGSELTLHGEVYTPKADVVVIGVGDVAGRSTEVRSIELPGGSTALRLGANERFDVTFGIDPGAAVVWVFATAYDGVGNPLDTVRQSLSTTYSHDRIPSVVEYGWPPTTGVGAAFAPVRLDRPAAGPWAVSGSTIQVRGELQVKAAAIRITLRTLDLDLLDSTVVHTANVDGGVRPLRAPVIDVALSLPTPLPTDRRLWLVLSAFDEAGRTLGTMRRVVTLALPGG